MIRFLVLSAFIGFSLGQLTPVIKIRDGSVQGLVKESFHKRSFWSFTGIPYAKPPVDELRFSNPQAPDKWSGVLNATKYSQRCIQRFYFRGPNPPIEGDEDCLYLNVYVPQGTPSKQLPVVVYLHWGGLSAGGADDQYFDPRYIMDFDVILVTLNFRVGIFGFLSTLDDEAPGNYGPKDQIMAFKWVQENIGFFGGLKESVTIGGAGGGASSVLLHLLSDASNGLFSKAATQSFSLVPLSTNEAQLNITRRQAGYVNCDSEASSSALIKCLRGVSAQQLLQTQDNFKVFYQFPYSVWAVVQEKASDKNPTPFLTKSPQELSKEGHFKDIPWLSGINQHEAILSSAGLVLTDSIRSDFNKTFEKTTTTLLTLASITNDTAALYKKASAFYLGGINSLQLRNQTWFEGYLNLWDDRHIVTFVYDPIKNYLRSGHKSLYLYYFQFLGEQSYLDMLPGDPNLRKLNWGVGTTDDLLYMFYTPAFFHLLRQETEIEFSKTWLSLWVNFATYGNPNPDENKILKNVDWQPLEVPSDGKAVNENFRFLNVTGNDKDGPSFAITHGFLKDRMEFWENAS